MFSFRRATWRQMILALVMLGIVGLIVELLLLEHTDSLTQWIPLVSLGVGVVITLAAAIRPTRGTLRAFQMVMAVFVAAGTFGLYFHFKGNIEWALERDPELSGLPLIWKALTGATPTLAPGALAQLGLLGLIYAYRHPALNRDSIRPDRESAAMDLP